MRLLSHNVLRNSAKGVIEGFPLKIEVTKLEVRETDCDIDFIRTLLPTISWKGLRAAANDLGLDANTIPEENHPSISQDEEFLQVLHKTLFDIHVMEGALICPETGRRFPIINGIPDMMLTNDELS